MRTLLTLVVVTVAVLSVAVGPVPAAEPQAWTPADGPIATVEVPPISGGDPAAVDPRPAPSTLGSADPHPTSVALGSVDSRLVDPVESAAASSVQFATAASTSTAGDLSGAAANESAAPMRSVEIDRTAAAERTWTPTDEIAFWSSTVVPEPGLDPRLTDTNAESVWLLVQFRGEITSAELDLLAEYGYEDGTAVTPTSRYGQLPVELLRTVADLESVRSLTAIDPAWKLKPRFDERLGSLEGRTQVTVRTFESLSGVDISSERLREVTPGTYHGELSAAEIRSLRSDGRVYWIEPRSTPQAFVSEGRSLVSANLAAANGGYDGSGVRVGVIDSGIDTDHPHFSGTPLVYAADWVNGGVPEDGPSCTHGTHVAGTIAGSGTDPNRSVAVRGVAPESTLVIGRIFAGDANCTWSGTDYETMFDTVRSQGARIISNSWGSNTTGDYDSRAENADTWARDNPDTLLVFSNGNFPDTRWVGSPALAKNVLAVGALRDGSRWSDGNVTSGSITRTNTDSTLNNLNPPDDVNRGSRRVKPDVYAPGEWITSSVVGGGYDELRGTSMAAPHVSGVAALYKEAYPGAGANEIKAALIATTHAPTLDGFGVVDADNAIFDNPYESTQSRLSGRLSDGDSHKKDVTVPTGAEQFVVGLSWLDPGHEPFLKSRGSGILANDLDLIVTAPDGTTYEQRNDNNVKKIVVDDPQPGTWTVEVSAYRVTFLTKQNYDAVYRVVTDEPTLAVDVPARVVVPPDTATLTGQFDLDVRGTGAPVGGIYATVSPDSALTSCGGSDRFIVGTLSRGFTETESLCFEIPRQPGTYPVEITVNSTNANRPSVTKTVRFVVPHPTLELAPHTRNVALGQETTYDLLVRNVSQGIGAYRLNVTLANPPIGSFRAATLDGPTATVNTAITNGGDSIEMDVEGLDTTDYGPVVLGRITARGEQIGRSNITGKFRRFEDEDGNSYRLPGGGFLLDDAPVIGELIVSRGDPEITLTPGDPTVGDPVTIEINDTDLTVVHVRWVIDGVVVGEGPSVVHQFDAAGEHTVVAEVTLEDESVVTARESVVVEDGVVSTAVRTAVETVRPGGTATVRLTATAANDSVSFVESFDPPVAAASVERVTVNGETASPFLSLADRDGVLVTFQKGGVSRGDEVTVEYRLAVPEDAEVGAVYTVRGNVTSDGVQSLGAHRLVVEERAFDGPAALYNADGNDVIDIVELGSAAADYVRGGLTIVDLGKVAAAYVTSA